MKDMQLFMFVKLYMFFYSCFDFCLFIGKKYYRMFFNFYMIFQFEYMEQFLLMEVLRKGIFWKDFYDFYENFY